jgi:hypothetical protein
MGVMAFVAVSVFSAVLALVCGIYIISAYPHLILDFVMPNRSSGAAIRVTNQAMDSNDFDIGERLYIKLTNATSENIFWLFQHEHLVRGGTSINTSAIDLKPKDLEALERTSRDKKGDLRIDAFFLKDGKYENVYKLISFRQESAPQLTSPQLPSKPTSKSTQRECDILEKENLREQRIAA